MVADDDKVDHLVAQMYACGTFEAKFLDDWEETSDKSWGETQPHFMRQVNKERQKLEREKSQKNYESSAILCEAPHPHTLEIPKEGQPPQQQMTVSPQQYNTLQ